MGNLNIDSLIEAASKRLGVTPEKLKSSLSSGNTEEITSLLSKSDREKINAVMSNPALAEKFRRQFIGGVKNEGKKE